MMNLFFIRYSIAFAAMVALEESGLPYKATRAQSQMMKDQFEFDAYPALLELNPKGTVPTLVTNNVVLTETVAVLAYIAQLAPERELLPSDPLKYAECLSRMAWMASTVHIAFRKINRPNRFSHDASVYPGIQAFGEEEAWSHLETIDQMLGEKKWIMGDKFSLVDCHAFVFWRWATLSNFPIETLASYSRLGQQMLERPSVSKALAREEQGNPG